MQLQVVKITIPRQTREGKQQPITVTALPEVREKPVHKVLVDMLGRLYNKERAVKCTP